MARVGGYLVVRTFAILNRIRPGQLACTRLAPVQRHHLHSTTACWRPGVVMKDEDPLGLTNKDWESRLTSDQYYVCREKGTEMPFSGDLLHNQEQGTYNCVCCGVPLFNSEAKFDSGSGWPSFTEAIGVEGKDETKCNILRCGDNSHGMIRTEVVCKKCDAHLGHVFPDGPQPTGDRFCMNSASLSFEPTDAES